MAPCDRCALTMVTGRRPATAAAHGHGAQYGAQDEGEGGHRACHSETLASWAHGALGRAHTLCDDRERVHSMHLFDAHGGLRGEANSVRYLQCHLITQQLQASSANEC